MSSQNSIATWSIYHPIGVIMIALAVVVLGLFSLQKLGIDLLPHIIYPEVRIRVLDPGVSAPIMEDKVTRYLEEQLAITEDAIVIQSRTREGRTAIDLSFQYGKDIDIALRDASTRLDRAKRFLPDTIEPPVIYKRDPSQIPIIELAVSSQLRDPINLRLWVDDVLSKWLINLPGVAAAEVGGGLIREIQILPDLQQMSALGLTLEDIKSALQNDNIDQAGGRLDMPEQEISTRIVGRWQSIEEIGQVRLLPKNDQLHSVYLHDIAKIIDTHEDERLQVRFNDIPGIKLSIQKQPQANTVAVADAVTERIHWLQQQQLLPNDITIHEVDNQAIYTRHALQNAASSALTGAILAMLIVYLFLGNIRHTLIIGTAIPLAILTTLTLMTFGDLTLNIMSLGGLALGIGLVVDNTIVMLENITRHQQQHQSVLQGAIDAVGEITSAIIASTTTNLAAILPFLFIVGLIGLLFRELIFTISAAMLASLIVAVTVVPALASQLAVTQQKGFLHPIERLLKKLYAWFMQYLLRVPILIILLFIIALWFSLPILLHSKQVFLPDMDTGKIRVFIKTDTGTALHVTNEMTEKVEAFLQAQPEVATVFTQMGGFIFGRSQFEVSNRSSLVVQLIPRQQRQISTQAWINKMRGKIKKLQLIGTKVRLSSYGIRGIRLGRGDDGLSLRLRGQDLTLMRTLSAEIVDVLQGIKGVSNFQHSAEDSGQELAIIVDRQRANALGFDVAKVGENLYTLMNGSVVTDYLENDKSINVRLRLSPTEIKSPNDLASLLIYNDNKQAIHLDEIADIQWVLSPQEIVRDQQQRITEITADVDSDADLAVILHQVQQRLAQFDLPEGYHIYEAGIGEQLQENKALTQWLLGLAVFLVFVVMAVQYESLKNPFVILLSIPFVLIGIAIGMKVLDLPLSMPVWLGTIMLAGMVVNNAIVLVETVELQRAKGQQVIDAIIHAGQLRLRPILMTTLTTVIGLLPLAIGMGEGATMLQPLAITIVFGLSFSLLVSMLLVPMFYKLLRH